MNENLKSKTVIFCDLDGTLIKTKSGETFPKGIWDMEFRFDVLDAIKKLQPDYILIVSNQGGIESGFVDAYDFQSKSEYISRAIREYCGCKCYCTYCETNDVKDLCRKPYTGMLYLLTENYVGDDFDYIKSKSLMIGDASGKEGQFSDTDKKTAENFGIDYLDVDDFVDQLKKDRCLSLDFNECEYRIKKEPTYRPFKDKEECWAEMQKHQPFGWVKNVSGSYFFVYLVSINGYVIVNDSEKKFTDAFDRLTFVDGTPFGIKEE